MRCSGLPERLTFDGVPEGLSANPVFTIDTADESGGTYTVTLSYLAWGFDWEANYVASVQEGGDTDDVRFDLTSWLTILNDNGQSFMGAELMAVAGTLNVVSDFRQLAAPPVAQPLRLTCYPFGSTAAGSPIPIYEDAGPIVVTGHRVERAAMAEMSMAPPPPPPPPSPAPVLAGEENLGDLKLYRVPVPVDVNAQGLKQVAFLREEGIEGALSYRSSCVPIYPDVQPAPAQLILETVNNAESGLGVALPSGQVTIFERSGAQELLVGQTSLRDFANGQDVELPLAFSNQVFVTCSSGADQSKDDWRTMWTTMNAELSNANPHPVTVRVNLGSPVQWEFRGVREQVKDGQRIAEVTVPANNTRVLEWQVRPPQPEDQE